MNQSKPRWTWAHLRWRWVNFWVHLNRRPMPEYSHWNQRANEIKGLPDAGCYFILPIGTVYQSQVDGEVYEVTKPTRCRVEPRQPNNYDNMRLTLLPNEERVWIKGPFETERTLARWAAEDLAEERGEAI